MVFQRTVGVTAILLGVAVGCGAMTRARQVRAPGVAGGSTPVGTGQGDAEALARSRATTFPGAEGNGEAAALSARYASYVARYRDATYQTLSDELNLRAPPDRPLSFDPSGVKYFDRIASELQLTAQDRQVFQREGMVSVDHRQRYSMGSAYFAIYARDLPVLITTDSLLHALHRSYDQMLQRLEVDFFQFALEETLGKARATLVKHSGELQQGPLAVSANDVDVYLTVASRLLQGDGAPAGEQSAGGSAPTRSASALPENEARVSQLLARVASLELETPDRPTEIYGGRRSIDYSQFRPRGHYTHSSVLKRYFRAMNWLGRADTGFIVAPPDARSSLEVDPQREARSAALLTSLLIESGGIETLGMLREIIDFMVGRADNATLENVQAALKQGGVRSHGELADDATMEKIRAAVAAVAAQQIRSQVVTSPRGNDKRVPPPQVFQMLGQRFVLDSYVLSQVVFDSISFRGKKMERMMPTGLDVMAALGNDEAVRLLKTELEEHQYSANLLALRKTVDERPAAAWGGDLYSVWLDALRKLDDPQRGELPQVMNREAWRRKQLQTQLSSWAELRHDTVLYAKQSYTSWPSCGYPAGFVEPYPEFYERLRAFAERGAHLLQNARIALADSNQEQSAKRVRNDQVTFLRGFAQTLEFLGRLARKELAAQPFTPDEEHFLRKTIDAQGGGSGPPRYDGWYPKLVYGGAPQAWKPVVADVHTNPVAGEALEVAVGDASFMIVAIDNQGDRGAYVGPAYSYYEFRSPASKRMTDEEWQEVIHKGTQPERPSWTRPFRGPPSARQLGYVAPPRHLDEPRRQRIAELVKQFSNASPERQKQLYDEIARLERGIETPPLPAGEAKR